MLQQHEGAKAFLKKILGVFPKVAHVCPKIMHDWDNIECTLTCVSSVDEQIMSSGLSSLQELSCFSHSLLKLQPKPGVYAQC